MTSQVFSLREDIDLYPGTKTYEGLPTYVIHDKWKNKFVNVGWLEYEIIQRWHLKDPQKIADSVCSETTLYAEPSDIEALQSYLQKQEFIVDQNGMGTETLINARNKYEEMKIKERLKWNPMAYLAFRIPLIRPNKFLDATLWMVQPFMSKSALYVYGVLLMVAIILVLQQWHSFVSHFNSLFSFGGVVYLFFALAISKTLHEFGHAYACKRFGLSVPSMGVFWMFIFGFLYTDTTESWKLSSRKKRVAIGSAGVLAEMQLAVIATFLWTVMPDGLVRYTCFYLATAAWIATLLINLSPFLRWDGYWVLSDLVGIQNLRERANKLCEWFFGRLVMGFDDPVPVKLHESQIRFSITFAILAWFYRVGIFLGIGLLIFERVFKLLGIFLLVLMVGRMICWPIIETSIGWFKRRSEMRWNKYSISSFSVIFFILLLLFIPWRSNIEIPGVLAPKYHIEVIPGVDGKVRFVPNEGDYIAQNETLFTMENPELDAALEKERGLVEYHQLAIERTGSQQFLEERAVNRERLETAKERYIRALKKLRKLSSNAPYDGSVIWVNKVAKQGGWIDSKTPILSFADKSRLEVYGYIGEYDLQRVYSEGTVKFYPENPSFKKILGSIRSIDSANVAILDYEILSSTHKGPIATVKDKKTGRLRPRDSLYLIRIKPQLEQELPILLRGRVVLKGERKSFFSRFFDSLVGTVIRESGF